MGKQIARLTPQAVELIKGYDWPGNVRVLENTIERAVAMENNDDLHVELPNAAKKQRAMTPAPGASGPPGISLPADGLDMEQYVADIERSLLQSALRRCNGVQTKAAEMLHLSYRSFRHLVKKYEL